MIKFKIRASAGGQIMGGRIGLTEKQTETLNGLVEKKATKGLTEKQQATLNELIINDQKKELPQGAKTYCESWLKEQLYTRRKRVETKYMEKGLIAEDHSLDFSAEYLELGMLSKNTEQFENEYMTGEPDSLPADLVIDVKNSWDCFTFPLLEDEIPNNDYFWQGQIYMHLTGRKKFKLIYTLMDTPINIIEREARNYCYKGGYDLDDNDILQMFIKDMTYKNIPDKLRIKIYDITYESDKIKEIEERVKLCRIYIKELLTKLK